MKFRGFLELKKEITNEVCENLLHKMLELGLGNYEKEEWCKREE